MKFLTVKMLALLAVISLVAVMVPLVNASTTGIISGVITDGSTGEKLSGVNITVKGTSLTTVTDAKGYFVITNVPPGTYKVEASLVGYGDASSTDVQVVMDATSSADIGLSKVEIEQETVVVKAKKSLLQPEMATSFYMVPSRSEKLTKNQPNNLYQIAGIVSTQPGVTVDGSGAPHIRGGRDNEIGYMIEGIPVIEPLTNVFGTNTVTVGMSRMQIYTGGYRAEYGNAISGVFNEIKKTGSEIDGGRSETTGGAQGYKGTYFEYGGVSPSGLDYYVGSYLWKSQFEKMQMSGVDSADTVGKFVFPWGNEKFSLLVNQGSARYYQDAIHTTTAYNEPVTPENDHGHQGYDIIGLTWSHNFSPSSFMTVRPYRINTRAILDALASWEEGGQMMTYLKYGTNQHGLQLEWTSQLSENHLFKTGGSVCRSENKYFAWVPGFGPPEWGDYTYLSDTTTTQSGLFIQDQMKLGSNWHAEAGLRYDGMFFDKTNNPNTSESQISPRLGLTYKLDNKNVFKTSWGRFIQFPPSYVMEKTYANPEWNNYKADSANLAPERSTSWDFTWERQLNDSTLARVTPYWRGYTNLLQSQKIDPTNPDSWATTYVNSGQGRSTGVEFYASKKMSDNWEGWLSYTWQRAKANSSSFTSQIDPTLWTYCDWDQRHTLNAVVAHRTGPWEHNWQLTYGSGLADQVDADTAQYQRHADGSMVCSWNITRSLPQGWTLGDQVYLNIWNLFNTGTPTQHVVYQNGEQTVREETSWVTPRFVTFGVSKKF